EDERSRLTHPQRVRFHHGEIGADERRQVDFVDHEQIGPRDSWSAFARNLFSFRDIDHVDREVCQFRTEGGGDVVAARFDEAQLCVGESTVHVVDRRQVHRRVFADCRVRAATGFDAHDALHRQRLGARENQLVFLRVDVVRDHIDVVVVAEALAQRFDERGFARSNRTADPDAQRVRAGVFNGESHEGNSRVYWVSCNMDAKSTISAAEPRSSMPAVSARSLDSSTASSSSARARCPSLWPSGISRTPAVTRLLTNAFKNARSAVPTGTPSTADRTAITIGRTGWMLR